MLLMTNTKSLKPSSCDNVSCGIREEKKILSDRVKKKKKFPYHKHTDLEECKLAEAPL